MADVFISTTTLSNQVLTAYDRAAYFPLRALPVFAQMASVKPGNVTSPGDSVKFTIWSEMSDATTALSETIDVDAVSLSDSQITVTPAEYGNAVLLTRKIKALTFVVGFDPDVANLLGFNMASSVDALARAALDGGTNEDWVGQASEAAIVAGNIITADEVRQKNAEMAGDNVIPVAGMLGGGPIYSATAHPDVTYDLKGETGDGAWVAPAQYVNTEKIYNNEVGVFGGFRWMETSRAKINADGGSSTVDTYTTYFQGGQSLALAESIPIHMVMGPVTDKLLRFQPLGWYGYFGFDSFREAALRRLLSASSIGAN